MARPLPPAPPGNIRVIDTSGREIVRPDVISFIYQATAAAHLARIRLLEDDKRAEGVTESRIVSVTDRRLILYPIKPWKSFTAYNDGTGKVHISVNEYQEPRSDTAYLNKDDDMKVDTKGHSILRLYFTCPSGETASVRVQGLR